jgi:hypothetical protein
MLGRADEIKALFAKSKSRVQAFYGAASDVFHAA